VQAECGASRLEDFPHLLQKLDVSYDASVIHVPLVVHRVECRNFVDETVDAATKVQGTERVTLLYACARLDDVLVVVEQHRGLTVAPLRPARHRRKHQAYLFNEVVAFDLVEGVAKVDLEETKLGGLVHFECVAKGVTTSTPPGQPTP
jgi:hypothetical protein